VRKGGEMKKQRGILFFYLLFFLIFCVDAKKIFVTGGAGFIGSHVVDALLERGDSVVIIDNFNDAYPVGLKYSNISEIKKKKRHTDVKIYVADICDIKQMEYIFEQEQPDLICHLAARAGVRVSINDPYEYIRSNITGTLTVFEMARKFHVGHIVCASSSSVYGVREDGPFYETDSIEQQSSPYGMTKHAGELLSYVYYHLFNISVTNLRFFTVYGPRGRTDMAPFIFMDSIHRELPITVYGDGSAVRDFTYIDDIVQGILKALDNPLGYENINLARGEPIVLSDFIKTLEGIIGKKAIIEHKKKFAGDVPNTHASIDKARSLLDYNPRVSIADGLRMMYEWYKSYYAMMDVAIMQE